MASTIKRLALGIGLVSIAVGLAYCSNIALDDPQRELVMAPHTIEDTLERHSAALISVPGVVAVAQGLCDGEPCIRVFVSKRSDEIDRSVPKSIEGYKVVVEESGEVRALPDDE
jgi:hypothetical protein